MKIVRVCLIAILQDVNRNVIASREMGTPIKRIDPSFALLKKWVLTKIALDEVDHDLDKLN